VKVLHEEVTEYNHIVVVERGRELLFYSPPKKLQGRLFPEERSKLGMVSTRVALAGLVFCPEPSSILVIGLGAGLFPRAVSRLFPRAEITSVEIDPAVVRVAREHFFFRPGDHGRVVVADGRDFVERDRQDYDVIYLDAYLGFDLPRPMAKPRFFESLGARLGPGGLLMMNLIPSRRLTKKKALKILLARFGAVAALECPGMENHILAAGADVGEADINARADRLANLLPDGMVEGLDLGRVKTYFRN
jgi:spermidine synthase